MDGQKKWSVIQVNSLSELGMLVDLLRSENHVMFDDEENFLGMSTSNPVSGGMFD